MIKIGIPYLKRNNNFVRVYCDIWIDDKKEEIWFQVEEKYGQYLCTERDDAYLIGILNWALRENHDIICEAPITEDLLYNIKTILMPSIVKYSRELKMINITAPTAKSLNEGENVGTGCSCGVDSFSSIYNHIDSEYKELNLTHLCLNNVGAFNECYSDYGIENVKNERYETTRKVSKEIGLDLIETDSNFAEVIKQNHYLTNTYSCCFAIYMLQKFWKTYYLASVGLDYSKFTIIDNDIEDSAHYDLLTLQCFSIPGLKIYSDCGEKNRLQKTSDIAEYSIAQKYLHVCIHKPYNCGVCSKCMRTLTALDALNKLDNFKSVFDLDTYKKNKHKYYKWLYTQHVNGDLMNEPTYDILKQRKDFKIGLYYKLILGIKAMCRKILPKKLKEKIKMILNK